METDDVSVSRECVMQLIQEKDRIEHEILQMKGVLDGNNIGMNESLIDNAGYPRHDIDVYQVRHARNRIICLQNDHKALMKQIEEGLHALHASDKDSSSHIAGSSHRADEQVEPIARINLVSPDSPAEKAGLLVDDLILSFGSVNYCNFKSLQDIGTVVHHSVDKIVPVKVQRQGLVVNIRLQPQQWSGRGYLGCNIVPYEVIER